MENVKRVDYKDDDGHWCFAMVESTDDDGKLNLLFKTRSGEGFDRATHVDPDGDRVR